MQSNVTVVAIPDTSENDCLVAAARASNALVLRGSENDVLSRYVNAALAVNADAIVRITADCPLICPELCDAIIAKFKREGADYASNIEPRTFPQGLDCEVFTKQTLMAAEYNSKPDEREHVTTWMRRADIKRVCVENPWPLEGRITLDTEADYRVICHAFDLNYAGRKEAA